MRVVFVEHPKFAAEVLHLSEIPDDIVHGINPDNYGLLDTVIQIFKVGLVNPAQWEDFEELKVSEMLQIWALYNSATAYEKDFE